MSRPRLVNIGSAVIDFVYRIDRLPAPGTEKTAHAYERAAGGGFNLMVAAGRSGLDVVYGGQHGTGPNGDLLREALAQAGIGLLTPASADADTGSCVVLVTDDAERTFVTWPGAEGRLRPGDMDAVRLEARDWLFTSGYSLSYAGSSDRLAEWIGNVEPKIPFVFDPAPVVADIPHANLERVLKRTDWLSCNVAEAEVIAGTGSVAELADRLLDRHCLAASGVVIRSGSGGSHLKTRGGTLIHVPAFRVRAIDTNGAGDTHIGAFVAALAYGQAPGEALRYANAAAAISVTRRGGASAPPRDEIEDFLKANT